MDMRISPSRLSGAVCSIPSKSDAHRSLICAALSDAPTELLLQSTSQDIDATLCCLERLGAAFDVQPGRIRVSPIFTPQQGAELDCRESGSTLRFLLPVAAALGCGAKFTGCGRLPSRPVSPLREELISHGCQVDRPFLPIALSGRMEGGVFVLPGDISSQFLTGLLLAFPLLPQGGEIVLTTPLQSASYVEMTIHTLSRFGVLVERTAQGFRVAGGQRYRSPGTLEIDADWSSAAFWLCAGAISGQILCQNLNSLSPQGDKAIASLLSQMGAQVKQQGSGLAVSPGELRAIRIDAGPIPDLIPVLAAVASVASGQTHIFNAARLRIKESDRLHAVFDILSRLGADIQELPDGLIIQGKPMLEGGEVSGWGDHRIAMSAAIAALRCKKDVIIRGAQAVAKSYPGFWEDFRMLGGRAQAL